MRSCYGISALRSFELKYKRKCIVEPTLEKTVFIAIEFRFCLLGSPWKFGLVFKEIKTRVFQPKYFCKLKKKYCQKKKKPQEVYTRITYLHGITQVTGWSQVKWHKHNTAKLNQNITNCKLKTKANEDLKVHSIPACWPKVNEMFGSQLLLYLQSGLYSCRFIRYNVEDNLCHLGFCVCIGLFSQCI